MKKKQKQKRSQQTRSSNKLPLIFTMHAKTWDEFELQNTWWRFDSLIKLKGFCCALELQIYTVVCHHISELYKAERRKSRSVFQKMLQRKCVNIKPEWAKRHQSPKRVKFKMGVILLKNKVSTLLSCCCCENLQRLKSHLPDKANTFFCIKY